MKVTDIKQISLAERMMDILMIPVMFALRGFKLDSLQETHAWHMQDIDPRRVNLKMSVKNHGNDKSRFNFESKIGFLFHAPILGGWNEFSVYEVNKNDTPFYIGWIVYIESGNQPIKAQVHRLPIKDTRIRMLDGTKSHWGHYFALNQSGEQVPLSKIGHGSLSDGSYKNIRLF